MRKRILTEKEHKIIEHYLENGDKLENFGVLVHRCRNMQTVENDFELIRQFMIKIDGEKSDKRSQIV